MSYTVYQTYQFAAMCSFQTVTYTRRVGFRTVKLDVVTPVFPDNQMTLMSVMDVRLDTGTPPANFEAAASYVPTFVTHQVLLYSDLAANRGFSCVCLPDMIVGNFSIPVEGEDAWSTLLQTKWLETGSIVMLENEHIPLYLVGFFA